MTSRAKTRNASRVVSVIDDAMDALQKKGIDEATRNEVLAMLWPMRREVLGFKGLRVHDIDAGADQPVEDEAAP